jgi:hypothetical protein
MQLFTIQFWDTSLRDIEYLPSYSTDPFQGNALRKSFTYAGPSQIEITNHLIAWLNNKFLPYFDTNQFLWELSISTCPEELRPYLILPPEQLTYKGTA